MREASAGGRGRGDGGGRRASCDGEMRARRGGGPTGGRDVNGGGAADGVSARVVRERRMDGWRRGGRAESRRGPPVIARALPSLLSRAAFRYLLLTILPPLPSDAKVADTARTRSIRDEALTPPCRWRVDHACRGADGAEVVARACIITSLSGCTATRPPSAVYYPLVHPTNVTLPHGSLPRIILQALSPPFRLHLAVLEAPVLPTGTSCDGDRGERISHLRLRDEAWLLRGHISRGGEDWIPSPSSRAGVPPRRKAGASTCRSTRDVNSFRQDVSVARAPPPTSRRRRSALGGLRSGKPVVVFCVGAAAVWVVVRSGWLRDGGGEAHVS